MHNYTAEVVAQPEINASPVLERDLNRLETERCWLRDPEIVIHPHIDDTLRPRFRILVRHRRGKRLFLSPMHTQRGGLRKYKSLELALDWAKGFGIPIWFAGTKLIPAGKKPALPTAPDPVY